MIPQCGRTLASRTVRLSVKSVWTISDVRHHGPDTLAPLARVSGLSDVYRHASSRTHTLTRTHACTHATDMGGIQPSQLPTHTRVGSEWGEIHSQHAPRATQRNAMDMRNAHSPPLLLPIDRLSPRPPLSVWISLTCTCLSPHCSSSVCAHSSSSISSPDSSDTSCTDGDGPCGLTIGIIEAVAALLGPLPTAHLVSFSQLPGPRSTALA